MVVTYGYRGLEMQLINNEMGCEYKIQPECQGFSMKLKVKYLINNFYIAYVLN